MSRYSRRVGAHMARVESLTKSMQMFCLDPKYEKFQEICQCDSILRREGDDFKAWKMACLFKYSEWWEREQDNESDKILTNEYNVFEEILCKKAIESPTQTIATQVFHLFCATGELKYIDLYYQCMGHERLPIQTRQFLIKAFKALKELFIPEVKRWLAVDPDHFKKFGLQESVVDFSYFDNIRERALAMKENTESINKMFGVVE